MTDSTLDRPCLKMEIPIIPMAKMPKAPIRIRSQ
jgi:hypothetical protein